MTIRTFKALAAATTLAAAVLGAGSAQAATATATANAEILAALTVTRNADLQFGTVVTGTAGSVTVTPAGVVTCTTTCVGSGARTPAAFTVTGANGLIVNVSSDASVVLNGSVSGTMTASLSTSSATVTIAAGTASFNVGGVLGVAAAQASGVYVGTFGVTANYQ